MSLEEIGALLREHKISPNELMGQNFAVDSTIFHKLSDYAKLQSDDIVLDVGAGFGFLAVYLSHRCKEVIAVEKDPKIADVLQGRTRNISNIKMILGDIFKVALPNFNKVVSLPPYYISSKLVTWLLQKPFEISILILQKEFSTRLVAEIGSEEYGWLTVLVNQRVETKLLDVLPREAFYPRPQVESVIASLKPWDKVRFNPLDDFLFQKVTRWLFTQRNKKLSNALLPFLKDALKMDKANAEKMIAALPLKTKRVRELAPSDFGAIADVLSKKNIL
jgi:16S rRNA (adenine1518-N6/adenine1519-N6)-dimethyltransferase